MRRFLLIVALPLILAAPAEAQDYAPLDQPGPPLSVPAAELAPSLKCSRDLAAPGPEPILLVHGTALDSTSTFAWNWIRALEAEARAYCVVELRDRGMDDIQLSAEHVVHAIRSMYGQARRRIDVVGHSQGGMIPRWALRFWPDTRAMVDDLVGLAASNHGTENSRYCFSSRSCSAAFFQQSSTANFIKALNSRAETFAGVDYTALYTRYDEVVTPNFDDSGSTSLRAEGPNVANVAVQDVCPANTVEHLGIATYDAAAYAIARAAIDNPGPADLAKVDPAVCAQPFMPGVDPATFATDYAQMWGTIADAIGGAEDVAEEPALRCYVTASCGTAGALRATPAQPRLTRRCIRGGRLRIAVTGDVLSVAFKLGNRTVRREARAPFGFVLSRRALTRTRASRLKAVVVRADGTRKTMSRSLPRCA